MIDELLHKININLSTESQLSDFCQLLSIKGNKGKIKIISRNTILDDVHLVGYTSLKVDDVGVVLFVGLEKRGVFLPMFTSSKVTVDVSKQEKQPDKKVDRKAPTSGIYFIAHSWYPVIANSGVFSAPEAVYAKGGDNQGHGFLPDAIKSVKVYNFTSKKDMVLLIGLNDVGVKTTDQLIGLFNDLVTAIKEKVNNIYICNIACKSTFRTYNKCVAFNNRISEVYNTIPIDIMGFLKDSGYQSDGAHLTTDASKKLAEFINNNIK